MPPGLGVAYPVNNIPLSEVEIAYLISVQHAVPVINLVLSICNDCALVESERRRKNMGRSFFIVCGLLHKATNYINHFLNLIFYKANKNFHKKNKYMCLCAFIY